MTAHIEGTIKTRVRFLGLFDTGWKTSPFAKDLGYPTDVDTAFQVVKSPLPLFLTLKVVGLYAKVGVRFLGFDLPVFAETLSKTAKTDLPFHFEPIKGFIAQGTLTLGA